jgi:molybdopterin converting factor small subunit
MRITIHFLTLFHTISGVDQEVLDVADGTTIDQLSGILIQKYQNLPLKDEKTYFVIHGQIVTRDHLLAEGDKVQIFQLLAGG